MTKSCVIESSVETQVNLDCMPAYALLEDDFFATVPVRVVGGGRRGGWGRGGGGGGAARGGPPAEEELYTSFEEAISARVAAVSHQLNHLPHSTTSACLPALDVCSCRSNECGTLWSVIPARMSRFWQTRRRALTLLCLGLNLLLLGFDCMGLLVLAR